MGANLFLGLLAGYLAWTRCHAADAPSISATPAVAPLVAVKPASGPCDYREILLKMKLWPLRDRHPELGPDAKLDKALRESRESYTGVIRSMPEGEEGLRLLADAADHYKDDAIELWIGCLGSRDMLAPQIQVDPIDILKGADEVYWRSFVRLRGDPYRHRRDAWGAFCVPYKNLREQGLSHQQALDRLVDLVDIEP
jgi:hypothetical protein